MKRIVIIICICMTGQGLLSQVTWKFTAKKIGDRAYEIHLTATIDEPWHIYSQTTPKGGPLGSKFEFKKNPLVMLQGQVKEVGEIEIYHDETFNVDVYAFSGTVDFVQKINLKGNAKTNVSGTVTFMACTRERCLTPETVKFSIKLE